MSKPIPPTRSARSNTSKFHRMAQDPKMRQFCSTNNQRALFDLFVEHKNSRIVAKLTGKGESTIQESMTRIHRNAMDAGYTPAIEMVEDKSKGDTELQNMEVDKTVVKTNVRSIKKSLKLHESRYVITWAQNATPVHDGFLASLKQYCDYNGSQLIIIPGRYKNPTSQWSEKQQENEYWVPEIAPYLMNARVELNKNIVVMGDIKIQPTAVRPLSGFDTITADKSGIFGSPRLQMTTVPTPHHRLPKIITTTGAVTVENYTDTKAGKKGEFHHVLGAVVVEIGKKGEFHMRQINADNDGSFIDLENEFKPDGVYEAPPPLALVMGDIHTDVMCSMCEKITFKDKDSIVKSLKPQAIVLHDWYDGYSGSHHHKNKIFIQYAKHKSGRDDVKAEIDRTFARTKTWLKSAPKGTEFYVVGSNHNEHLTTWLERNEPKSDPRNAEFYHYLMYQMFKRINMGDYAAVIPNPLQILCQDDPILRNLVFMGRDDSLMIADIECSYHGDIGANGARGSVRSFDRIGVKNITGHGHSPGIEGGAYRTGTNSVLKLEYTSGPSSWLNTDCLIYANGKRCLINKINGKWRL